MNQGELPLQYIILSYIILIWTITWKGVALWRSAKYDQKNWFTVFLVLNPPIFTTLGILEIVYLFRFAKKRMTLDEVKHGLKNLFTTKEKSK